MTSNTTRVTRAAGRGDSNDRNAVDSADGGGYFSNVGEVLAVTRIYYERHKNPEAYARLLNHIDGLDAAGWPLRDSPEGSLNG